MSTDGRTVHALLLAILTMFVACSSDGDPAPSEGTGGGAGEEGEAGTGGGTTGKALNPWEQDIVGTWCYYSSSYSEYRCATFNADRTACYFEVPSLSSASKGNRKCYQDWYVDTNQTAGVYKLYVKGDNTGGDYWAGYQWNPSKDTLEGYDGVARSRQTTISCDFCK